VVDLVRRLAGASAGELRSEQARLAEHEEVLEARELPRHLHVRSVPSYDRAVGKERLPRAGSEEVEAALEERARVLDDARGVVRAARRDVARPGGEVAVERTARRVERAEPRGEPRGIDRDHAAQRRGRD